MIELGLADHQTLKAEGRSFNCNGCPERIQLKRRCREDREDFGEKDDPVIFPIYVHKGGTPFGFCPAKANWDSEVVSVYNILTLSCETGQLYESGGISDQPYWFVDLLSWFAPMYDNNKFISRFRMIANSFSPRKGATGGGKQGRSANSNPGGHQGRK